MNAQWIKELIEGIAPRFLLAPLMRRRYRPRVNSTDGHERFDEIYRDNRWGDAESRSGPGSNPAAARALIEGLPPLLTELNASTFLDIPCGDFCWMQQVNLPARYIGGDLVKQMIDENQKRFGSDRREFRVIDLTKDLLPTSDVLMVRDCFIHLSFDAIAAALRNIYRSKIPYVLISDYPNKRRNWDIDTGGFRPVNLQRWPFSFPKPMKEIAEFAPESEIGTAFHRTLALWRREDIPSSFH